jgi:hypothetical protein
MKKINKSLLVGLVISICTTYVQAEPKMFRDDKGRWLNSEGGNIYGDSRFNPNADPRYNLNADPRFNLNADPVFNIDANPKYNIEANPNYSIDGDIRYQE